MRRPWMIHMTTSSQTPMNIQGMIFVASWHCRCRLSNLVKAQAECLYILAASSHSHLPPAPDAVTFLFHDLHLPQCSFSSIFVSYPGPSSEAQSHRNFIANIYIRRDCFQTWVHAAWTTAWSCKKLWCISPEILLCWSTYDVTYECHTSYVYVRIRRITHVSELNFRERPLRGGWAWLRPHKKRNTDKGRIRLLKPTVNLNWGRTLVHWRAMENLDFHPAQLTSHTDWPTNNQTDYHYYWVL